MIKDIALRRLATGTDTWIDTLVPYAGTILRAVGVEDALRTTPGVGIPLIIAQARADTVVASGVGSAWRGVAEIPRWWLGGWWFYTAVGEGIALVAVKAGAHGRVIDHLAIGVYAASSGAWITALLPHASSVAGTVGIYGALGSAVRWTANVIRQAGAGGCAANVPALGVGSARRGGARVLENYRIHRRRGCKFFVKLSIGF